MKLKLSLIYFTLSLNFVCHTLNSQRPIRPYEKLTWSGVQPIWYHTIIDSSDISELNDGYGSYFTSRVKTVIKNDCLFSLHQKAKQDYDGLELESRNINNGQLVWKISFDLDSTGVQEVGRQLQIYNDKVFLLSQKREPQFNNPLPFIIAEDTTLLVFRIFNDKNGDIIEETCSGFNDSLSFSYSFYFAFNGNRVNYFFIKDNEEIKFIEQIANEGIVQIGNLNKLGYPINDLDTIIREINNPFVLLETEDGFLSIENKDNLYYSNMYTKDFKSIINSNYLESLNEGYFEISFRDDQFLVLINSVGDKTLYHIYENYNLLEVIDNPEITSATFFARNQKLYMLSTEINDINESSLIFSRFQNGKIDFERFDFEDYRGLSLLESLIDNETLIIKSSENARNPNSSGEYVVDINAKALSILAFDIDELGITVSNDKYPIEKNTYSIYPNPSSGYITLKGFYRNKNITILDQNGIEIIKFFNEESGFKVDISLLNKGIYYLLIDGVPSSRFIKI
jgi:hypothetical protein